MGCFRWMHPSSSNESVRQWLCDNDNDDNIWGGKSRISRIARLAHNHSYHSINVKPATMLLRQYSKAFQAVPGGAHNQEQNKHHYVEYAVRFPAEAGSYTKHRGSG
ncbi:hypothetical protein V2G26_017955 [Clonostachys chloroleuca]